MLCDESQKSYCRAGALNPSNNYGNGKSLNTRSANRSVIEERHHPQPEKTNSEGLVTA